MAAQVPLFAMGTGAQGERLRRVLGRLIGREVSLSEDTTATTVEAMEAIAQRLTALERTVASAVRTTQASTSESSSPAPEPASQST